MEREEKLKALDAALGQIEKQFGKGAVMKLGDPSAQMNVETIPTGSLSLDIALGLGGIPKGRIIEMTRASLTGTAAILSAEKTSYRACPERWLQTHSFPRKLS